MPTRIVFGPNLQLPPSGGTRLRGGEPSTRPDAVTVEHTLEEVLAMLRAPDSGGWIELDMRTGQDETMRIGVSAGAIRYVREA